MPVTTTGSPTPSRPAPAVSVGMMVRNEERWIESALENLLGQTFPDLELLVLDNASTDRTPAIAESFAARDERVRSIRHAEDLGAIENLHQAVRNARGEFFLLASGHDLFSPDYIETLAAALREQPEAVLAFGRSVYIDEEGREAGVVKGLCATDGVTNPVRRFNLYMWANQNPLYGLIRLEALREVRTGLQVIASGQVLLQELAILGQFTYVHEVTFFRRLNRPPEKRRARVRRYGEFLFRRKGRPRLPHWRMPPAILRAAWRTRLPPRRRGRFRIKLLLSSLTAFIRFWDLMMNDVADLLRR